MSPGRPPRLDDVKRSEVCALLTAGLTFNEVARYVGCVPRTIRREMHRNAPFRREVHDALLSARLAPDKLLRQAAGRNWRAAAWLLERTDPHTYSRRNPAACTLEDLDAASRWLIDAAIREVAIEQRSILFEKLHAIVSDVQGQLLRRTNPRRPIRLPATSYYDIERLLHDANGSLNDWGYKSASKPAGADKNPSDNVPREADETSETAESDGSTSGRKAGNKSAQPCSPRAGSTPSP